MRKLLATAVLLLGLASAQFSVENLKPSFALVGGTQGFGGELSWHCLLFQPPVGEVRPALDLAYDVNGHLHGAFLFRYLYPVAEGLKAGVGLGVALPGFSFANLGLYFRADDGTNGSELWRSQGTAATTEMIVNLETGSGSSGRC